MKNVIILDWDGTLHNTLHLYGEAFRKAYEWLVRENLAPKRTYTDEEVSIYLGMNAKVMWNTFMPSLPDQIKEKASLMIGEAMVQSVYAGKAILYPGALEVLGQLSENKNNQLIFLSNCRRIYMQAHREYFHLSRWYEGFYCCEDYNFIPKEEIFPYIKKQFPGNYIIVGDRLGDLKIAGIYGYPSVACRYGFGTEEEIKNASCIIDNVKELPAAIDRLTGGFLL